jgi:hypothetical protein
MRNAQSPEGNSRYEFQARQVKRSEVALDVVEFEVRGGHRHRGGGAAV